MCEVLARNCKTFKLSARFTYCDTFNVVPRFDEDIGKVELDYPRDMSMWSGVEYNIDTVFQWKDGKY
jgi:matrix metalloproteinase-16 (membrane-inserted)